jgi:prevent-host-death family protein
MHDHNPPATAAVAELKARLSEFLRLVKGGRELIITERGRPIAQILPVQGAAAVEARRDELVASGAARPPVHRLPADFWSRPRPADSAGRSLELLLEERAEGR